MRCCGATFAVSSGLPTILLDECVDEGAGIAVEAKDTSAGPLIANVEIT